MKLKMAIFLTLFVFSMHAFGKKTLNVKITEKDLGHKFLSEELIMKNLDILKKSEILKIITDNLKDKFEIVNINKFDNAIDLKYSIYEVFDKKTGSVEWRIIHLSFTEINNSNEYMLSVKFKDKNELKDIVLKMVQLIKVSLE